MLRTGLRLHLLLRLHRLLLVRLLLGYRGLLGSRLLVRLYAPTKLTLPGYGGLLIWLPPG